ncbi:MAG: hypothetical protein JSU91_04550 [Thermoplasmatales archaeon]|nr:MAG: hypothetical protein JSU91_04550 [Thermoplasmatales archaeon]
MKINCNVFDDENLKKLKLFFSKIIGEIPNARKILNPIGVVIIRGEIYG